MLGLFGSDSLSLEVGDLLLYVTSLVRPQSHRDRGTNKKERTGDEAIVLAKTELKVTYSRNQFCVWPSESFYMNCTCL